MTATCKRLLGSAHFIEFVSVRVTVTIASLTLAASGSAQQIRTFDHGKCKADAPQMASECTAVRQVTAQAGELIKLNVINTCPDLFDYTVVKIPREEESETHSAKDIVECSQTKTLDINHDPQYGGYIIYIVEKPGVNPKPSVGAASVTISVKTSEWKLGFGGGFAVTSLRDPAFALGEISGSSPAQYRLMEQKSRQDDFGKSVVSFVHVNHTNWEKKPTLIPAISFGLGLEGDRNAEYYLGPSWLFGDRGAITIGMVAGAVTAPPAGKELGDTLTEANALANLNTRRRFGAFLGISFRFLGNAAADLNKPFLGQASPTVGGTDTRAGEEVPASSETLNATVNAGNGQSVKPGDTTPQFVVVKVEKGGKPLPDVPVRFSSEEVTGVTFVDMDVKTNTEDVANTNAKGLVKTKVKLPDSLTTDVTVKACVTVGTTLCRDITVQIDKST